MTSAGRGAHLSVMAIWQVLSIDRQARAFTVRLKDTGELRIVRADEVVVHCRRHPLLEAATARAGPIVAK